MGTSNKIERAIKFATQKHKGQKRIGGKDYISHPIAVYEMVKNQGYGEDYQITALFHDLLEDTDTTEEEILSIADQSVLTAVKLLTKENGCDMESYINGIRANPIAFAVKCADRLHNLQCALETSTEFKKKYILETVDWYLDFSKDIEQAVNKLKESIDVSIVQ